MRPRPQWGQGWHKGDDYNLKRGFPMKIVVIRWDFGIVTILSINYDERRRAKKGRPHGGSLTENTINLPIPPCLGEALRREFIAEKTDFHCLGETIWIHACFYRAVFTVFKKTLPVQFNRVFYIQL
jgi:hypothetical protein